MKHQFIKTAYLSFIAVAMVSCYEDEGNYDYSEKAVITAENMPASLSVIQKADTIVLKPSFSSSTEGNIDNNTNFEFGCKLWKQTGTYENNSRYIDIDTLHTKDIVYPADLTEGDYIAWYTVTDKRTNVVTNFEVPIKVTSATYEGWMVLCDDAEGYARLDMVSMLGAGRISAIHDIAGTADLRLRGATSLYYDPWPKYAKGDGVYLSSNSGTYVLNANTLKATANLFDTDFLETPDGEQVVKMDGLYKSENFAITDKGNLYMKMSYKAGTMFIDPVNTFTVDGSPEFHVAPFIGVSYNRPLAQGEFVALFYDKDNKQFVKWDENANEGSLCLKLEDPANKLFSFNTGMDMVSMVNTKFSGGVVYSVLQDNAGQRYVYGINLAGGSYEQTLCRQITAPGFDTADQFAFHSQYPYMFYNSGNKIYGYHLLTGDVIEPITTGGGNVITLAKFCPFMRQTTELADQSDEFIEQQYYLIVGLYDTADTSGNGGKLQFYKFNQAAKTMTLMNEYAGFAKIRDVVYRER